MIESSRLFLFTEYARKGCGTIETHGTDYKVWEALPVSSDVFNFCNALLTHCRIASLPIRGLKSFSLGSRTTRSLRRRGLRRTTLVVSHTAQTPATQKACIPKNSDNIFTTAPRRMERTVSRHDCTTSLIVSVMQALYSGPHFRQPYVQPFSLYIQYHAMNTFSTPATAVRNVCACTS
jgi:hypothetical protein